MFKYRICIDAIGASLGPSKSAKGLWNLCKFSTSSSDEQCPLKTVDLAYASYETAVCESLDLPPLLILHGVLGSKSNWTSLSKAIHKSTGRKVIAVDARNHGDSPHTPEHTYMHMAEDVVALMKKLSIMKASILGHSMGGRTAMYLALSKPELVSNLIVEDISPIRTSPNIYSMIDLFDAMMAVSIPPEIPLSKARRVADSQLAVMVKEETVRNFVITNLIQLDSKEYGWRVNLPVLKMNFKDNIADFPDTLTGYQYQEATYFLAGGVSDHVGRKDLPLLKELFPKADLQFIEGAGHWVHSQKPEQFLKKITDFLARH